MTNSNQGNKFNISFGTVTGGNIQIGDQTHNHHGKPESSKEGDVEGGIQTIRPSAAHEPLVGVAPGQPVKVFFSYAHEDRDLRDKLASHLKLMERQKLIEPWSDQDITGGEEWDEEIERELNAAQIVLLLISADFLASDFCWGREMERAMERHATKEARVIPIIVRPADWHSAPFGKLNALPRDGEPITTSANIDQAFADVAKGIRRVVESLQSGQ